MYTTRGLLVACVIGELDNNNSRIIALITRRVQYFVPFRWLRLHLVRPKTHTRPSSTLPAMAVRYTYVRTACETDTDFVHLSLDLTFSVSAAASGDVYIHLSAPATHSWVGAGTGSEMAGSVMWILYEGADKNNQSFAAISDLTKLTKYRPNTLITAVKRSC
jgi:hypothetical protein